MPEAQYHLGEIPKGLQIFEERLEVVGMKYRRDDAISFANGRALSLEFEREPYNRQDPYAIKIIGCHKGSFGIKRQFIGYVPSEVAALIVEGGYYGRVIPRLLKTYVSKTGFVEILFQVHGPKGERFIYKKVDPVSLPQENLSKSAHYIDYTDQVKFLKQEKRYNDAIDLLLKLVSETEKEAISSNSGVAPWYYEQLAIIYAKLKRSDDELRILERYEAQQKAPGGRPIKLTERLEKIRKKR